jgi:hypothetical protein
MLVYQRVLIIYTSINRTRIDVLILLDVCSFIVVRLESKLEGI